MKRWKIAALCAVCVMGTLLQGCSIYDKADLDKMSATPGDAFRANADSDNGGRSDSAEKDDGKANDEEKNAENAGENTEDLTKLRDYSAISTKKYSWYIVRDKNHGMSGCDNSFPLDQYDAYYVDRTCAEKGRKGDVSHI